VLLLYHSNDVDSDGVSDSFTVYVFIFYIIWEIFTRSDEIDIFPSLPHLRSHHLPELSLPSPYQLPYHVPQLPSPPTTDSNSSVLRIAFNIIYYPFYIVFTLLAYPVPLIIYILSSVFSVISTLAYPLTATARLGARTLVVAPWNIFKGIVAELWPLISLFGWISAASCLVGIGAWWVDGAIMGWIRGDGPRKKGKPSRSGHRTSSKTAGSKRSASHLSYAPAPLPLLPPAHSAKPSTHKEIDDSGSDSPPQPYTPSQATLAHLPHIPHLPHVPHLPSLADLPLPAIGGANKGRRKASVGFDESATGGLGRGSAREGKVLGVRQRGSRASDAAEYE
jgi:hypothetical protein